MRMSTYPLVFVGTFSAPTLPFRHGSHLPATCSSHFGRTSSSTSSRFHRSAVPAMLIQHCRHTTSTFLVPNDVLYDEAPPSVMHDRILPFYT